MTLDETVLQKVSEWSELRPSGRSTLNLSDEGSGWSAALTADRCDDLGCLVWDLTLRRTAGPLATDAAALRAWADLVASQVTGLLEQLAVVEVDAERLVAQLRSNEPTQRGGKSFYYEVLLRGAGEVNVRRYQTAQTANARREQVAFALTHEALAKLAGDLTAEK